MFLYVVRNKEGKFFRSKGFGGYGQTWVTELEKAKFYPKVGQAKSRVTFFAGAYPQYGICDIIVFEIKPEMGVVVDMTTVTQKKLKKKALDEAQRKADDNRRQIEELERKQHAIRSDLARRRAALGLPVN